MIYLANYSLQPFHGWIRTKTGALDFFVSAAVTPEGDTIVRGHQRHNSVDIDILASLRPGEVRSIDARAATANPIVHVVPAVSATEMAELGIPRLGNTHLTLLDVRVDGAGYLAHFRARLHGDPELQALVADLWVLFYPGTAYAQARLRLTNSSPTVASLAPTELQRDLVLSIGSANVAVVGKLMPGNVVLPAGTKFGDGQSMVLPLVCIWQRLADPESYNEAGAFLELAIGANGTEHPWPMFSSYPRLPSGASKLGFHWRHFRPLRDMVGTWKAGDGIGVPAMSGVTGAQPDQLFVGAECGGPDGCGVEQVYYLAALTWAHRPCHHRELGGERLDFANHPDLRLWDGRAHWHRGVSPDQLGKERPASPDDMQGGWWGPDVEHWLLNTLALANRIVWCPALTSLLEDQAIVYLGQYTTQPGLSTSSAYAARSVGWECIAAIHLLEAGLDLALHLQVRARFIDRVRDVLLPNAANDIWDIRIDDPRLGTGEWWMPWQASVGAYGLFLAGDYLGSLDAQRAAVRAAQRVVEDAWTFDGTSWLSAPVRPVATGTDAEPDMAAARACVHEDCGIPLPLTDAAPMFDGSFNDYGMPLAVWVLLQANPNPADARSVELRDKAQRIWDRLQRDTGGGSKWFPPSNLTTFTGTLP